MLNVWLWEAKGCKRNPLLTSAYDSFPLETTKTSLSHHRDRDEETALNLWELRNKIKNILKRKLLMGPLTLGLTKLMQVCQWLLAASEHILHQSLPLTESLVPPACSHSRFGDPWPTPAPWGKTNGFLPFWFSELETSTSLGYLISISHELAQIFFSRGTTYANGLTCKDVTKRESQGLVWGSIFFTLYINDLEERRCSKWITLADDINWRGRQNKEGGATKFRMHSLEFGDSCSSSKFWSM